MGQKFLIVISIVLSYGMMTHAVTLPKWIPSNFNRAVMVPSNETSLLLRYLTSTIENLFPSFSVQNAVQIFDNLNGKNSFASKLMNETLLVQSATQSLDGFTFIKTLKGLSDLKIWDSTFMELIEGLKVGASIMTIANRLGGNVDQTKSIADLAKSFSTETQEYVALFQKERTIWKFYSDAASAKALFDQVALCQAYAQWFNTQMDVTVRSLLSNMVAERERQILLEAEIMFLRSMNRASYLSSVKLGTPVYTG